MTKTKSNSARLHAIVSRLGMNDDEYRAMLFCNFGVASSKELSESQMARLIDSLSGSTAKRQAEREELDRCRKRLIAAIGGWLKSIGQYDNANKVEYIKAIACRAAEKRTFNQIPHERLRSLYASFCHRQSDMTKVAKATDEALTKLTILN